MSQEFDIEHLIQEVQAKECLWDKSNENYKDRIMKRRCWSEICEALFIDFEDMTEEEKSEKSK